MKDKPYKILIVDDSLTQQALLTYTLEKQNWDVLCAENSVEALKILSETDLDLIILDYHLPGMNGKELCQLIRTKINFRSIPIIMFTMDNTNQVEADLLLSGADEYIPKTETEDILILKIRNLLNRVYQSSKLYSMNEIDFTESRILAIDDSITYLTMLVETLGKEGFKIDQALNGKEALKKIEVNKYDCILVDLLMPDMNGIELCKKIVEKGKSLRNPMVILMLTEHEDKENMTKALGAGADDFVGKSNDLSVVKARIRALLRRKLIQEENLKILEELKNKELEYQKTLIEKENAELKAQFNEKLQLTVQQLEREIIERKKIEERLKNSNADLEQFAYAASHDLKEPLRSILSFSQIIKENNKDKFDNEGNDFINRIIKASTRMRTMIDDLLEYSKLNGKTINIEKTNMREIIEEVKENMKIYLTSKKARIILDEQDDQLDLHVDKNLFHLVFQNIIQNGIKYNDSENPIITFSNRDHNDEIVIEIKDNGIGMVPERLDDIFTIFRRLQNNKDYEGTGIGLSIVKRIVELHKGKVFVESEKNIGTTFFLKLPKEEILYERN